MILVDDALKARQDAGNPIRVGVVGAGFMCQGLTNQIAHSVPGMRVVAISNRTSTMIDVAKVQGQVHAQSVQKVGELTEKNPHEAVSIIRSWLHEEAA